jgi:hypothetical protein
MERFQYPGGGRLEASHVTLKAMAAYAYDVRDFKFREVRDGPARIGLRLSPKLTGMPLPLRCE